MKWILYWTGLFGALFGALYWKNSRGYVDKTRRWYLGKSLIEGIMLVSAAAFMPAILVVYASMWMVSYIKRPALKIGAGFVIGTLLMMSVGWALELLVLTGVFAVDLISDDFLGYMEERRIKRGVATVLDGRIA
jgi:hypothetical protein